MSVTTVSHAFSGRGSVAAATRRRVFEVAERLGYRPDVLVRAAQGERLPIVSLVVRGLPGLREAGDGLDYFIRFSGAAAMTSLETGYALMLVADPSGPHASGSTLATDAFLVTEPVEDDPLITLLEGSGIPYLTVGRVPGGAARAPYVDIETPRLTRLGLDHLVERGARRVAIVVGTARNEWNLQTIRTYTQWARERGQEVIVEARRAYGGERSGLTAGKALMARADPPDAIYALQGPHAVGVLRHLRERRIRVPERVQVVAGVECAPVRDAHIPITTIDLEPEVLAERAIAALLAHLRGTPMPVHRPGVGVLVQRDSSRSLDDDVSA